MKKTKDAHFWIFFGFLPDFTRRAKITPEMVKMLVLLAVKFSFIFFYSTTIHWKMCCTIEQRRFFRYAKVMLGSFWGYRIRLYEVSTVFYSIQFKFSFEPTIVSFCFVSLFAYSHLPYRWPSGNWRLNDLFVTHCPF